MSNQMSIIRKCILMYVKTYSLTQLLLLHMRLEIIQFILENAYAFNPILCKYAFCMHIPAHEMNGRTSTITSHHKKKRKKKKKNAAVQKSKNMDMNILIF